jgi:hypothetical protein
MGYLHKVTHYFQSQSGFKIVGQYPGTPIWLCPSRHLSAMACELNRFRLDGILNSSMNNGRFAGQDQRQEKKNAFMPETLGSGSQTGGSEQIKPSKLKLSWIVYT